MSNPKKNIVILGAGYCGVRVAQKLAKFAELAGHYQIVLIDKNPLHFYAADLYEIATAYYPKVTDACLRDLSDSISIPLKSLVNHHQVEIVEGKIVSIDVTGKKILLANEQVVPYEYLVLTLGAVTHFYDLPGAQEHAFPLKTLTDGLALDCHFEELFKKRWKENDHSKLHVVVGGGGFTGVEYACELPGFIRNLSQKYHFSPHEVEISVIQSGPELVGLGHEVSTIAFKRFRQLGIKAHCDTQIVSYDGKKLFVKSKTDPGGQNMPADVLIWTAGIKPNPLVKSFPILDKSGGLEVEPTLEANHYPKVYAAGDNAAIFDPVHHSLLPKLGVMAVQQAPIIAYNIWADITGNQQKVYKPAFIGFIVALGGKFFVYHRGNITWSGIIPWLMRRVFDLWYFASLMPLGKALRKWWHTENIFMQND